MSLKNLLPISIPSKKKFVIEAGVCLLLMSLMCACSQGNRTVETNNKADATEMKSASDGPFAHQSKFIRVNGIQLNYLDWGGSGKPVVMIHGIADSPHIFDDLAQLLSPHYRVIAYARRGHGYSDSPEGPYDLPTMVEDLRQLLDSLNIPKAHLLGWSMGGNEITMFAGLYPERVEKLIYLESGYDWTDAKFLDSFGKMWAVNVPAPSDLLSLEAYKNWFHKAWVGAENPWSPGLQEYIRDITRLDSNGHVILVPDERSFMALFESLASPPRDYTKVKAPALALYSSVFFPADVGNP